jgi:UDP-glucose 4-epimerase
MRVLVTGGAGFIGSHIVDALLASGHEPSVVDDLSSGSRENLPEGVPVFEADIRDRTALAAAFEGSRPEAVCHHAAQVSVGRSVNDPAADAEINIVGMLNVIAEAVRVGADRFVFASSGGALYGETSEAADESTPATPISPYGIAKWMGERYLGWAAAEWGLAAVSLRYSNVYGPRQSLEGEAGVVAAFCRDLEAGKPLRIFGDGLQTRDFVYAGDVARANLAALEKAQKGQCPAINVCSGAAIDINVLAEMLSELVAERMGRDRLETEPPGHEQARAGDIRHSLLDPSAAAQLLGWRPRVTLREGLEETVAWLLANSATGSGPA